MEREGREGGREGGGRRGGEGRERGRGKGRASERVKLAAPLRMRFALPAREAWRDISCSQTARPSRTRFFSLARRVLPVSARPRPAAPRRTRSARRVLPAILMNALCRTQRGWISPNIPRLTRRSSAEARRTPCANLAVLKTHLVCIKQLCAQPAPTRSTPTARRGRAQKGSGACPVTKIKTALELPLRGAWQVHHAELHGDFESGLRVLRPQSPLPSWPVLHDPGLLLQSGF